MPETERDHDLFRSREVRSLVLGAPSMFVAVETNSGPHVTPELFAWALGRFWIATARRTLKARVLDPGSSVGIVVGDLSLALVVGGTSWPLDPLRPTSLVAALGETLVAPPAAAAFVVRNYRHLLGLVREGIQGLPHSPETLRVLIAIAPQRAALVERGEVTRTWGEWPERRARSSRRRLTASVDLDDLSLPAQDLVVGTRSDAVVAWRTPHGPIALPAEWDGEACQASVPADLFALSGASRSGDACVAVEHMHGYEMWGKRGVLLRGATTVTDDGDYCRITLDPRRAVGWQGLETESVALR